jgi:hypothetical protein
MTPAPFDTTEDVPMTGCTRSSRGGGFALWLRVILIAVCGSLGACESGSGIDSGMNSSNVAKHLNYDEKYPFVGYWKLDPSDDMGLVINKAGHEKYSVWFCSPRGSTELDSLSPTKVIGDKNFKIVDENTIEVIDKNGHFKTYARFQ